MFLLERHFLDLDCAFPFLIERAYCLIGPSPMTESSQEVLSYVDYLLLLDELLIALRKVHHLLIHK